MPYVDSQAREKLQVSTLRCALTTGGLTYQLTQIVSGYVARQGLGFDALSEAVAALECAKLELYRRIVAPYEDVKCAENGDVYASAIRTGGRLEASDAADIAVDEADLAILLRRTLPPLLEQAYDGA